VPAPPQEEWAALSVYASEGTEQGRYGRESHFPAEISNQRLHGPPVELLYRAVREVVVEPSRTRRLDEGRTARRPSEHGARVTSRAYEERLHHAPNRGEPQQLGHHVAREPERRVDDGAGIPAGGQVIVEASNHVGTQERPKASGVPQRVSSGFDQGGHEPVRVRTGDGMERETAALDELSERGPGRDGHPMAGPLQPEPEGHARLHVTPSAGRRYGDPDPNSLPKPIPPFPEILTFSSYPQPLPHSETGTQPNKLKC
jgi:hypothetical protein